MNLRPAPAVNDGGALSRGHTAQRLTERTETPGVGGGLGRGCLCGVCVVASAGPLLLVVVVELAGMLPNRVSDAACPVGVVDRPVERQPLDLVD